MLLLVSLPLIFALTTRLLGLTDLQIVGIAIGVILVALALLAVVVVLSVPRFRQKIFPYRDANKAELNKKYNS